MALAWYVHVHVMSYSCGNVTFSAGLPAHRVGGHVLVRLLPSFTTPTASWLLSHCMSIASRLKLQTCTHNSARVTLPCCNLVQEGMLLEVRHRPYICGKADVHKAAVHLIGTTAEEIKTAVVLLPPLASSFAGCFLKAVQMHRSSDDVRALCHR